MYAAFTELLSKAALFGSARAHQLAGGRPADPQPSEVGSRKVCVLGNVVNPSEVLIESHLTITQAIEAAGGMAGGKKGEEARVYSMMADTREARVIYVDLRTVEKRPYKDLELQSFDIVIVSYPKRMKVEPRPAFNPCPSMLPESLWR